MFELEEEQKLAAELFHTNLPKLETGQERSKAFRDIVFAVKKNSYEYHAARLGSDVSALNQVIAGKKALEELAKAHISLN
jgi:DNA primase